MKIKKAKIITDNSEQEGFLFIESNRTLFIAPSDSKGRWPAIEGCYCSEDWQSYIDPLLKKGILFDPWHYLKEVGVAGCDLTSPLIHVESGLVLSADFGQSDDNIHFMVFDNALQTLYEVANVYLEQDVTWNQELLNMIFSTKSGKDGPLECKDVYSLLSYFRGLWLNSNPEAVELMEANLIRKKIEKRLKHANG